MPDLFHSLLKQDIGHLRIIAELWGIELTSPKVEGALEELSASLLDPDLLAEIIDSLSSEADSALTALVHAGGRLPWTTFTRKYGDIREAGAGKRDRERPYLKPTSTTEILFYRGLLARAFFDTEKGPQEFAYIPDDLLALLNREGEKEGSNDLTVNTSKGGKNVEPLGRPASPGERGQDVPANDFILDDATTMLAALRLGITPPETKIPQNVIRALLQTAKILDAKGNPQPEPIKMFLESSRDQALKILQDAWIESDTFNELRLMPDLVCEGEWTNQPRDTREFLLNLLDAIPEDKWWSLYAFIRDVKQKYADFQRPAGDYDSWFIKSASEGEYLRGFAHWNHVDGALVKYFITNVLHWLGQVDLSIAEEAAEPTAFRIRSNAGKPELNLSIDQASDARPLTSDKPKEEKGKITASSNGRISVERTAPRVIRYQIARFCRWEEPKDDVYHYHITTNSLAKARDQGLKVEHLLALLVKHTDAGIPPSLVKALKRWEVNGTEARVHTQVILKVSRPEVLEEMRKSKAARFLGEMLSPTTAVVKGGAIQKVMDALTELGLLAEVEEQKE
jgi:hypothetical protein